MARTLVTTVCVLLLFSAIPAKADAQDQNTGNPSILQAIKDLRAAVDALAANQITIANQLTGIANQLTSLSNSVNALNTPLPVIATGFLVKPAGYSAECDAQNVGTTAVGVRIEMLRINGALIQDLPSQLLLPGNGTGLSLANTGPVDLVWCRFTVGGSSANVRANLTILETTGVNQSIREAR
jgi:hypothetical protein